MRKLIFISLIFNLSIGYSQNVKEVSKPENLEYIDSIFSELMLKRDSGLYTAIEILENGLKHSKTNFEIHKITFNLGFLYTQTNQYDKCIDMWLSSNKKGICYNYQFSDNPYPPYLTAYNENETFLDFIKLNDSLRNEISKDSKAEYFVNLPVDYDKFKRYPLIIVLHGGIGSFYSTLEDWKLETFNTEFISVYPQGRDIKGSFYRSYGINGVEDITEVYNHVIEKYSIDTTSVILAGQSAGGALSLSLVNDKIPAKGILLAFPVKPRDFDISSAQRLNMNSTRIFMICGEQDKRFYPGQLELSNLLDSAKVGNIVVKYPDLEHGFPEDFESQIDKGIKFIFKD